MRTRDKKIGELQGRDWLKMGLALIPFLTLGLVIGACGGEDSLNDPAWETITDVEYGRTFRCFEQVNDSPWCYEVTP